MTDDDSKPKRKRGRPRKTVADAFSDPVVPCGNSERTPLPPMDELIRMIPNYDPFRNADGYWFDESQANKVVNFFSDCLVLFEGEKAGQPFHLRLWQAAIAANLYGWRDNDTGYRRFREVFLLVGKKNGKTPLLSGLILFEAFCGGEPGAQLFSAAWEKEQASLIFRHCAGMIALEEEMSRRAKVYRGQLKAFEIPETNTIFRSLNRDAKTKHGLNIQFLGIDELHAFEGRDLVDTLVAGVASRRQPIIVYITTADYVRESVYNEKYTYAKRVRDGEVYDPTLLPVLYELEQEDDWKDESLWIKANPNLGVSVSLEYMRRQRDRAIAEPSFENAFRRLHCNQRTQQAEVWIPVERWDECEDESVTEEAFEGRSCWCGLDLASTRDMTALVRCFPDAGDYSLLATYWCPGAQAEQRAQRGDIAYRRWMAEGLVRTTPGDVIDYGQVLADIAAIHERTPITGIAVDAQFQGAQFAQQLQDELGLNVVVMSQGWRGMSAPTKQFEVLVCNKRIRHGGDPVLRWMMGNVQVVRDSGDQVRPSRKSSADKIDGVVAAIMGLQLASVADAEVDASRAFFVI